MAQFHLDRSGLTPRVVSFDLDGVIIRGPFNSQLRPRISEHIGRAAALAHLAAEEREPHIWQAVRKEHDRRLSDGDFVGAWDWQTIYDAVSRGFGGEPMPDLASIVREACLIEDAVALLPGAWLGLHRLKSAGLRLVAITNGYHCYQWPVLVQLAVADLFEHAVITPDQVGFAKPDPRIFGSVPGLVAHVGDLLLHDVLGANLAGLRSVWLDAGLPEPLCQVPPTARVAQPAFTEYLQRTLDASRYRQFHPQATLATCTPAAVVRDVDEAAAVVLDSISEWTPGFELIERAIADGPLQGAAAVIGDRDDQRLACFGRLEADGAAVTPDTWYDLASLTKVLCTVPLCLQAIAEGRLDPRAPLREVLPEVAWMQERPNLGDATVLQLATHTSGLPAWQPLFTLGLDRPTLLARVLHTPLQRPPGDIEYSDLGFIVLGYALERCYGPRLDVLAQALFARVGLDSALGFVPAAGAPVAPTEQCPWRSRIVRGEVHDENAAALGGVAGHAGLFGTLRGVAGYVRALLEGRLQSSAVLSYLSQEHARARPPDLERRGFGWALMHPGWSGGDLMSQRSIGHTGFTGTGVWIDLERGRYSVLLTNRVHPSRHIETNIVGLRRAFNHVAHAK